MHNLSFFYYNFYYNSMIGRILWLLAKHLFSYSFCTHVYAFRKEEYVLESCVTRIFVKGKLEIKQTIITKFSVVSWSQHSVWKEKHMFVQRYWESRDFFIIYSNHDWQKWWFWYSVKKTQCLMKTLHKWMKISRCVLCCLLVSYEVWLVWRRRPTAWCCVWWWLCNRFVARLVWGGGGGAGYVWNLGRGGLDKG